MCPHILGLLFLLGIFSKVEFLDSWFYCLFKKKELEEKHVFCKFMHIYFCPSFLR